MKTFAILDLRVADEASVYCRLVHHELEIVSSSEIKDYNQYTNSWRYILLLRTSPKY